MALAIGDALVTSGRLPDRDAIFMLTWQEIDEVCSGRAMFPRDLASLTALRRQAHATESACIPPDTFYLPPAGVHAATDRVARTLPVREASLKGSPHETTDNYRTTKITSAVVAGPPSCAWQSSM